MPEITKTELKHQKNEPTLKAAVCSEYGRVILPLAGAGLAAAPLIIATVPAPVTFLGIPAAAGAGLGATSAGQQNYCDGKVNWKEVKKAFVVGVVIAVVGEAVFFGMGLAEILSLDGK